MIFALREPSASRAARRSAAAVARRPGGSRCARSPVTRRVGRARRSGSGPDHRRDPGQSAGATGAVAGDEPTGTSRRLSASAGGRHAAATPTPAARRSWPVTPPAAAEAPRSQRSPCYRITPLLVLPRTTPDRPTNTIGPRHPSEARSPTLAAAAPPNREHRNAETVAACTVGARCGARCGAGRRRTHPAADAGPLEHCVTYSVLRVALGKPNGFTRQYLAGELRSEVPQWCSMAIRRNRGHKRGHSRGRDRPRDVGRHGDCQPAASL